MTTKPKRQRNHPPMTAPEARAEAERCLHCLDAPCIRACPAHIDIPSFIAMIRSNNVLGAAEVVRTANALANICGNVCPEEIYCQSVCTRAKEDAPILIRELHFYATQMEARTGQRPPGPFPTSHKMVAVVGGGPAGLGCAFELAKLGHDVTIFDPRGPGGVPKSSIPSFRLFDKVFRDDMSFLSPHFKIERRTIGGDEIRHLQREFDAVFLGVGLGEDRALQVEGERLAGVLPVLRFLEAAKRGRVRVGNTVVVVGGGNVSLDAAATARRMGAERVMLLYRRTVEEMKVWKSEREEAQAQGVEFRFLTAPVEITGNRRVTGVKCRRMRLSRRRDRSGRRMPVEIKGSDFWLEADTVIVAIGQHVTASLPLRLKRTRRGFIAVDRKFRTSEPRTFAGGDATSGEGTIVQSLAQGKLAAHEIHRLLMGSIAAGQPRTIGVRP